MCQSADESGSGVPEKVNKGRRRSPVGSAAFYVKRKPSKNPKVKWKKKLSILWRPELANIQNINNLPKYRQKSKDFVVNKIMEKVPEDILQIQFCEELMERDYNEIGEIIKEYKKQKKQ